LIDFIGADKSTNVAAPDRGLQPAEAEIDSFQRIGEHARAIGASLVDRGEPFVEALRLVLRPFAASRVPAHTSKSPALGPGSIRKSSPTRGAEHSRCPPQALFRRGQNSIQGCEHQTEVGGPADAT